MDSPGLTPLISSALLLITFIWMLVASFRRSIWWGLAILFFSPISTVIFAYSHWDTAKKPVVAFMLAFIFHIYIAANLVSSMFGGDMVNTMSDMQEIAEQRQRGELTEEEARQKIQDMVNNITGKLDSSGTNPDLPGQIDNDNALPEKEIMRKTLERLSGAIPDERTANDEKSNTSANVQSHAIPSPPVAQKPADELFGRKEQPDREQLAKRNSEAKAMHTKLKPRKQKPQNRKPIAYNDLSRFIGATVDVHLGDSRLQHGVLDKATESHIELYRILSGGRFAFEIKREKIKQVFISQH